MTVKQFSMYLCMYVCMVIGVVVVVVVASPTILLLLLLLGPHCPEARRTSLIANSSLSLLSSLSPLGLIFALTSQQPKSQSRYTCFVVNLTPQQNMQSSCRRRRRRRHLNLYLIATSYKLALRTGKISSVGHPQ